MLMQQRWTVIGIFEDQAKAKQAMENLKEAGFSEDAIGYVYRGNVPTVSRTDIEAEENAGGFTSGIIGGIAGAADALLTPVLGPSVANTIPTAVMPVAEQAIERLQTTGGPEESQSVAVTGAGVDDGEQETVKMRRIQPAEDGMREPEGEMLTEAQGDRKVDAQLDEIERTPTQALGEVQAPMSAEGTQNGVAGNMTDRTGETVPGDERRIREEEATGAFTGGIVGGVLGAAVALLIPVLGPAFAGGILVTVFSAALGAVTGGFLGVFAAMGVPEEQAYHYEQEFKAGRTIITVKTEDRQQDALDILYRNDAHYANAHSLS